MHMTLIVVHVMSVLFSMFFLIVSVKDNKGEKIHDPSKADFSPWTQFCGYMHVVPSIPVALLPASFGGRGT